MSKSVYRLGFGAEGGGGGAIDGSGRGMSRTLLYGLVTVGSGTGERWVSKSRVMGVARASSRSSAESRASEAAVVKLGLVAVVGGVTKSVVIEEMEVAEAAEVAEIADIAVVVVAAVVAVVVIAVGIELSMGVESDGVVEFVASRSSIIVAFFVLDEK